MTYKLPPSCNWYSTTCADTNDTDLFAFGSSSTVFVYHIPTQRFWNSCTKHQDRIVGVRFLRGEASDVCCSVCTGGRVIVWNAHAPSHFVYSQRVIERTGSQGGKRGGKQGGVRLTAMCTVLHDRYCTHIYVGTSEGGILCVPIRARANGGTQPATPLTFATGRGSVNAMAAIRLPDAEADLLAVAQGGSVHVVVINDHEAREVAELAVEYRGTVQSLSWQRNAGRGTATPSTTTTEGDLVGAPLLASISGAGVLAVHSVRADGTASVETTLQTKREFEVGKGKRQWCSTSWADTGDDEPHLLVSVHDGKVICLKLADQPEVDDASPSQFPKYPKALRKSGYRSFQAKRAVYTMSTFRRSDDKLLGVILTSMDRSLIVRQLCPSGKHDSVTPTLIPCLGGHPTCLAVSLANPTLMAIGVGDGTIKVWDVRGLGNNHNISPYAVKTYWKNIPRRINQIACHPVDQPRICFVGDGGVAGVLSCKTEQVVHPVAKNLGAIRQGGWALRLVSRRIIGSPMDLEEEGRFGYDWVVLTEEGTMWILDTNTGKTLGRVPQFPELGCQRVHVMEWKRSLLALGTVSGAVCVFYVQRLDRGNGEDREIVSCIFNSSVCTTRIRLLRWTPSYRNADRYHLAMCGEDGCVAVVNLLDIVTEEKRRRKHPHVGSPGNAQSGAQSESNDGDAVAMEEVRALEVVRYLEHHQTAGSDRVADVKWCRYERSWDSVIVLHGRQGLIKLYRADKTGEPRAVMRTGQRDGLCLEYYDSEDQGDHFLFYGDQSGSLTHWDRARCDLFKGHDLSPCTKRPHGTAEAEGGPPTKRARLDEVATGSVVAQRGTVVRPLPEGGDSASRPEPLPSVPQGLRSALWGGDWSAAERYAEEDDRLLPVLLALSPGYGYDRWAAMLRRQAAKLEKQGRTDEAALCYLALHRVDDA
eukprot:CAMPEP_0119123664 /NCGR_PEP_ID=MMETSP1310-20130426/3531_1 /TAXON_ID=464262 /ORGANISM="Genus nov. species nov., Strain RCC2339" /LENGTH=926 /DNA_ID=CAMNT_0007113511 /DNA_START=163 /DNA_END=2940 /DNA_ORIENTATION=+